MARPMTGKAHSLPSLLEDMALITGQAYVVLSCRNDGGSHNLGKAFPALGVDDLDTLAEGPLIFTHRDDESARKACNALIDEAVEGYEATGSIVTSTIIFVGRANEGDCSRTALLQLTADVDAGTRPDKLFRFSDTGHLIPAAVLTGCR